MVNKSSHLLDALMRGRPQPNPRGTPPRAASPRTAEFEVPDEGRPSAEAEDAEPEAVDETVRPAVASEPVDEAPEGSRSFAAGVELEGEDEAAAEEPRDVVLTPRRPLPRVRDTASLRLPADEPTILGSRERPDRGEGPRSGRVRRGEITVSQQEALLVALLVLVLILGAFVLGRRTASPAAVEPANQQSASLDFTANPGTVGGDVPSRLPYSLVAIEYAPAAEASAKAMAGRLMRDLSVDAWVSASPKRGRIAVLVGHFASETDPGLVELTNRLQNLTVDGKRPFAKTVYPTRVLH